MKFYITVEAHYEIEAGSPEEAGRLFAVALRNDVKPIGEEVTPICDDGDSGDQVPYDDRKAFWKGFEGGLP
jgi:hypothetical protein